MCSVLMIEVPNRVNTTYSCVYLRVRVREVPVGEVVLVIAFDFVLFVETEFVGLGYLLVLLAPPLY